MGFICIHCSSCCKEIYNTIVQCLLLTKHLNTPCVTHAVILTYLYYFSHTLTAVVDNDFTTLLINNSFSVLTSILYLSM